MTANLLLFVVLLALPLSDRLYIGVHTVKHRPGEVRDQWRPVKPDAAARARAALPAARPDFASGPCHAADADGGGGQRS